jgi:DNA-binding MarR family transcriptional regulator
MTAKRTIPAADLAQTIERSLRDIRAHMNRRLQAEYSRGNLTAPQTSVMQAVYESKGIALKDLCQRVRLAHSTVSGIVDRLQARGLLERRPSDEDRRYTIIAISPMVPEWMSTQAPRLAAAPLLSALSQATSDEKESILHGVETLLRLLESAHAQALDRPEREPQPITHPSP